MKSPFTLEQVEAMTVMAHAGETHTAIGRKYGVDRKVIGRLIRGEAGPLSVRDWAKARPTDECNSVQRAIACAMGLWFGMTCVVGDLTSYHGVRHGDPEMISMGAKLFPWSRELRTRRVE